jgi:hypothetical protein
MPHKNMKLDAKWHKTISLTISAAAHSNLICQLYEMDVAKDRGTPFGCDETQSDCVCRYSFTSLSDTKQTFYPAHISLC